MPRLVLQAHDSGGRTATPSRYRSVLNRLAILARAGVALLFECLVNLYFRLLMTFLRTLLESRMSTRELCVQSFRVWPHDIDAFGHMNNGRYLQIMDVARLRWLLRTGTIAAIRQNGWRVSLGGNITRYRRPLNLFSSYTVHSRLLCWDRRWFYLEHVFRDAAGRTVATGMSRAAFRCNGGWVTTAEVMAEVDPGVQSPTIPAHISQWMAAEEALYAFCNEAEPTERTPKAAILGEAVSTVETLSGSVDVSQDAVKERHRKELEECPVEQ